MFKGSWEETSQIGVATAGNCLLSQSGELRSSEQGRRPAPGSMQAEESYWGTEQHLYLEPLTFKVFNMSKKYLLNLPEILWVDNTLSCLHALTVMWYIALCYHCGLQAPLKLWRGGKGKMFCSPVLG